MIANIFKYVPFITLNRICCVSKRWNDFIRGTPLLWKHIVIPPRCNKFKGTSFAKILGNSNGLTETLSIEATNITVPALKKAPRLKHLKTVSIKNHVNFTQEIISSFLEYSSSTLRSLDLSGTKTINWATIWSTFKNLKILKLNSCTFSDCTNLFKSQCVRPSLKELQLSNSALSNNAFILMSLNSPNLEILNINNCTGGLNTSSLLHLGNIPLLKSIYADMISSSNYSVDEIQQSFLLLSKACSNLTKLSLSGCLFMNDVICGYLADGLFQSLQFINLSNCSNMNNMAVCLFTF